MDGSNINLCELKLLFFLELFELELKLKSEIFWTIFELYKFKK